MNIRHTAITGACATILTVSAVALAEDLTLSTYYASPRGVYQELRTTGNSYLAMQAGTVGIGTNAPLPIFKMHIVGTAPLIGITAGGNTGEFKLAFCGPAQGCFGADVGWYAAYAP